MNYLGLKLESEKAKLIFNIARLTGLFILFLALELHARQNDKYCHRFYSKWLFIPDPVISYRQRENIKNMRVEYPDSPEKARNPTFYYSTTQDGYRGSVYYPPERAPGSIRIITYGGSTTFGWGVDDDKTWSAQLEAILNRNNFLGKKAEIINGGTPLYGNFLAYYKHRFSKYNPDIVILLACPEMPILDKEKDIRLYFRPYHECYVDQEGILRQEFGKNYFIRNIFKKSFFIRQTATVLKDKIPKMLESNFFPNTHASTQNQDTNSVDIFLEWKKYLDDNNTRFFVLVRGPIDIIPETVAALNQNNIKSINIKKELPVGYNIGYYTWNGHYTEKGNRKIAELIFALLSENTDYINSNTKTK